MADILTFHFEDLKNIFNQILESRNNPASSSEIVGKRRYASMLFMLIKKINRNEKYRIRSARDELQEEKVRIDSNRMQLQNLLYEINHLKREIRRNEKFRSSDESLSLLPQGNYIELLGLKPIDGNEHLKRQTLLEYELKLRKQLSNEYKEILNSKKQLLQDIMSKSELLASFLPSLRKLIAATRPLQVSLQMPMNQEWKINQLVHLLPQPLYIAYMNSYAFQEINNSDLSLSVEGSDRLVNEIEHLDHIAELKKAICIALGNETTSCETDTKFLLEPHPLLLQFTIGNLAKNDGQMIVILRYFPRLHLVTANAKIQLLDTEIDLIPPQDILYVYADDCGDEVLMDVENKLKKIDLTYKEFLKYLTTNDLGKPYGWAQQICGIKVYNKYADISNENIRHFIEKILNHLLTKNSSRISLLKQIKLLTLKNVDTFLQDEQVAPSCSLVQWVPITYEEYASNTTTSRFINSKLVNPNNIFYRSVIVRGSAKMECFISISGKFPNESPLWSISVHWNGLYTSINSTSIKTMEHWTNSLEVNSKNSMSLLPAQLIRTMNSFDIFAETESSNHNPSEFSKEKPYIKQFSKRIRLPPYRLIKNSQIILYKQ